MSEHDDNKPNVTALPGGSTPNVSKDALRNLKADLEHHIECQRALAPVYRAKYLALLEEGFTEAQAIELCKNL